MSEFRNFCDKYDNNLMLEGGKKKRNDEKLMKRLENAFHDYENGADNGLTENNILWICWMYGKLSRDNNAEYVEMLEIFDGVEKEFDEKNRVLCEKYHFVSLFQVASCEE